jgi:tRNA uracil 4-sulfurtransferase
MIFNVILIRYDELTTKKGNRFFFIQQLKKNIILSLGKKIGQRLVSEYDFMYLIFDQNDNQKENLFIKNKLKKYYQLKKIAGISSISWAWKIEKEFNIIKNYAYLYLLKLNQLNKFNNKWNFKLEVKRTDKSFAFNSLQIKREVGEFIVEKTGFKVDVQKPKVILNIDIKQKGTFIWHKKAKSLKGLPVQSVGRVLLLLSGGIDSPVAAFKLIQRGLRVDYLHFTNPPLTKKESIEKVIKIVKKLNPFNLNYSRLFICDWTLLQKELMHLTNKNYLMTIMRRMFIRIANKIAALNNINLIATGDVLAQVASQTVESLNVIDDVLENFIVIRPLICMQKNEIIKIAKSIKTYKISIQPFFDCCQLLVPKHPVIYPDLKITRTIEESFIWKELIDHIVDNKTNLKIIKN